MLTFPVLIDLNEVNDKIGDLHDVRILSEVWKDFEESCQEIDVTTQQGLHLAMDVFITAIKSSCVFEAEYAKVHGKEC